jgi:Na+:H+ antiporter, NhaB family
MAPKKKRVLLLTCMHTPTPVVSELNKLTFMYQLLLLPLLLLLLLDIVPHSGTNLPSCATPNGQAAFLFILTSAVSPLVHLSYTRMVQMTLPYTIMLTISGLIGILTLDSGD